MKKIDLHQDIILSFEGNIGSFVDDSKVINTHGSYAWNLYDYNSTDTVLVWSANWPYHLEWDLNNIIDRKITYDKNILFKRHSIIENIANIHDIGIVKNQNDLNNLKWFNIIHHIEWVDHVSSIDDIKDLYNIWVRSIWFVWNFDNWLSSNNTNANNIWLTDLGKEVVDFMNSQWMIIDTAHMNHASMMDVIHCSKKPILNSHSNIRTLHNHTRNVEDEFIDALPQNGWVLWLSVFSSFISNNPTVTIDDYLSQIKYIKDRIWEDHIALWTDFHGLVTEKCIQWVQHISQLNDLEDAIIKFFWSAFAKKFFYDNSMRVLRNNL